MSHITITISTNNDTFADDCCNYETARILHELATLLEEAVLSNSDTIMLRDLNGNMVGKFISHG